MIRLLFSRSRILFMIVSLFFVFLHSGSLLYAEESLICADDIEKYCKGVKPGGGRILNCLKSHENELAVTCKGKIEELKGLIKDAEQACSGDIKQFCKEVQPGEGRIVRCLKEHDKELSSSCSARLETIGKRLEEKENKNEKH